MNALIKRLCVTALIAGAGVLPLERVAAQTFSNLHNFGPGLSDRGVPGAVILSSNVLYGTTYFGGSANNGTVFKMNSDGTGYTNLHGFSPVPASYPYTNSDGANPGGAYVENSALVLSGSALYGTTFDGGKFGHGTVFRINVDGTGFTNLYNFIGAEGGAPNAGLVLAGDTLYGVATGGGTGGLGTVFKLTTNGTGLVVLHDFSDIFSNDQLTNGDGGQPVGGLLLSGNTLYGTADAGGTLGDGTVFAVNTDGLGFTNLHNFDSSAVNPSGILILSGDVLYGTASSVVFAINTNGSGYTNLFTFAAPFVGPRFTNSTGIYPSGGLILSGNALYGTASSGGRFGNGTMFAVNTNGTGFVNLFNFPATPVSPPSSNNEGALPSGGLALSGNTLYGTANSGGQSGYGTVFSLTLPPPPSLAMIFSGTNIILNWPTNSTGFTLQSTTNLGAPANWSTVFPTPVFVNGQNAVTNPASGARMFYRLSQ